MASSPTLVQETLLSQFFVYYYWMFTTFQAVFAVPLQIILGIIGMVSSKSYHCIDAFIFAVGYSFFSTR